ncbi:receptor-type tyrosine-protein phosphatase F-like [Pagrus major]|uniref:receptor-type tyrosine-protein phosphatase F-like n=1 Tax=Pagrus major TaxID=143350 RepID=UPI003CC85DF4
MAALRHGALNSSSVSTRGECTSSQTMDLRFTRLSSLTRGPLYLLLLARLVLPSHTERMPSFIKSPDDQTGISGGVASFVCQAVGEPKPRITWMKKGKKVSSQRFEVIEFDDSLGSVLRIQPLRTHRDEAIYECTATNSVGEINSSAKLTVLEEDQIPHGFPTIDMGPQLKVVERTRTATMLCAASGNPDPQIYWFKDFLPVDISSSNGRIKQLRSDFDNKCEDPNANHSGGRQNKDQKLSAL